MRYDYVLDEDTIPMLAALYKKYFVLSNDTKTYIIENVRKMKLHYRLIGVHVRATDYTCGFNGHPKFVTPEEYLAEAKRIFLTGRYDKIFLATDDFSVIDLFKYTFKENLVFYQDTLRSDGVIGVHQKDDSRELHHYKLGLEVLRDVYMLANCDVFI